MNKNLPYADSDITKRKYSTFLKVSVEVFKLNSGSSNLSVDIV